MHKDFYKIPNNIRRAILELQLFHTKCIGRRAGSRDSPYYLTCTHKHTQRERHESAQHHDSHQWFHSKSSRSNWKGGRWERGESPSSNYRNTDDSNSTNEFQTWHKPGTMMWTTCMMMTEMARSEKRSGRLVQGDEWNKREEREMCWQIDEHCRLSSAQLWWGSFKRFLAKKHIYTGCSSSLFSAANWIVCVPVETLQCLLLLCSLWKRDGVEGEWEK